MDTQDSSPSNSPTEDPRRNLFWMFISFMGISIPKHGQERRAMVLLLAGVIIVLAFVATGMFALFHFW